MISKFITANEFSREMRLFSNIKVIVHSKINTELKQTILSNELNLFHIHNGTNFIYKLSKPKSLNFDVGTFNTNTFVRSRISVRLNELERLDFKIKFHKIQSDNLQLNLKLIDTQLPNILAHLVLQKYKSGHSKIVELLSELNDTNPLDFDLTKGHPFYEYKIKNFLVDSAVGMTPETVWTGKYDATGGIIIVKATGDLVCYHIYNKNEFEEYLLNNTKLEQPQTDEDADNPGFVSVPAKKPYKFGWVYEENGEFFIKLNLQIRFI